MSDPWEIGKTTRGRAVGGRAGLLLAGAGHG